MTRCPPRRRFRKVAGSGTTLRACLELGRHSYGFEVSRDFYRLAVEKMLSNVEIQTELPFDKPPREISTSTLFDDVNPAV